MKWRRYLINIAPFALILAAFLNRWTLDSVHCAIWGCALGFWLTSVLNRTMGHGK